MRALLVCGAGCKVPQNKRERLNDTPFPKDLVSSIYIPASKKLLKGIIDFPNPYVAGLFKAYLEEHTSLPFKAVVNTITMPPKIER